MVVDRVLHRVAEGLFRAVESWEAFESAAEGEFRICGAVSGFAGDVQCV